jgi:protoporphyrinogen oxidase
MTGLAAGFVTGFPIYEARDYPGGICSSYYMRPGEDRRLLNSPKDKEAFRFEKGGGHWIFGTNSAMYDFFKDFLPVKKYRRRSSVYFRERDLHVPYPLQNHLRFFEQNVIQKALSEMTDEIQATERTMKDWLEKHFGSTLCELFFFPFHDLYTAGLYHRIAPQDPFKTPLDISQIRKGAIAKPRDAGYNITFIYPEGGLDVLSKRIASQCDVHYGKSVTSIDLKLKAITFLDHETIEYDEIISTIPLNTLVHLCGLSIDQASDPYSSVHVLNIGAIRGKNCPDDHWLYTIDTKSGFHRVGFYSNVDSSFLPTSSRESGDRVSIYAERAYPGGKKLQGIEIQEHTECVKNELQEWGFIDDIEVTDSTWIDVAYTWAWPDSSWRQTALMQLENNGIYSIGRYGRWNFQGIAESLLEGLSIGRIFRNA